VAAPLEQVLRREAPTSRAFLRLLAHDVIAARLPRTLLGNIATQRRGPGRGTIDVKAGGGLQLTGAARVAALELGSSHTNTVDRFREAGARRLYTETETREITDAYEHLMRLRLVHQLERLAAGAPADNRLVAARLSRSDALLLRDALAVVERVQAGLRVRFATDGLA
jgi:CBS domain-containing protein